MFYSGPSSRSVTVTAGALTGVTQAVCFTVIYFTVSYLCILRKFPHLLFYATATVSV